MSMTSSCRARSGGKLDRHDVEAVVEILAELARRDRLRRGRGSSPRPARTSTWIGSRAADALDSIRSCEHAQELRLQRERQLADLVEEERAAVRPARSSPAWRRDRAGERALLVTEQLALEQVLGDRRAVDVDERRARARGPCGGWPARAAPCRCRVSPVISTVTVPRGMTRAARSSAAMSAGLSPRIPSKCSLARSPAANAERSASAFSRSVPSRSHDVNSGRSCGSAKYSSAPARISDADNR